MIGHGVLGQNQIPSVLGSCSILAPSTEAKTRNIVADLLLTALIDAFSILVIFLLMSFSSTGEILYMDKGVELPKATRGEMLDRTSVVKVSEGKIYLEEKELGAQELTAAFLGLRKSFQETHPNEEFPSVLTVQADRRVKYEVLNSVVLAASQAGISDIKFAVLMK